MTRIQKLVVNGFKSFGKWTELPFSNGFNVILGPNGSGKSNVLDALCFVLGRMSSKSMRAEKLGFLVYNGGKTKKPSSRGEVSIFFDNSGKSFPVDEPAVKVSRLVKPDGQSIYRINDERRTRQQVLDLLAAAQIDPDGHNIILQGDIMRFVDMSPEERRQVIEEIAGISVYEDKKLKALNELERVEQSLREADILLSERKAHLKDLKQDRDQAIRYKELNDKIRQSKATLLGIQLKKKESEKLEIEKSIAQHNDEIARQRQDIAELKGLVDGKKAIIADLNREIEEKGEKEQVRLSKEIEELRVDIGTSANRLLSIDAELQKISERRDGLKKGIGELEARIAELTASKSELEKARNSKLLDKTRIEASIEKIRRDSKVANIGDIELDIEKIEKELDSRQAETAGLVERKQGLLREKDRLEVQLQSIEVQISKVAELEKANKLELEAIKSKHSEFKQMVLELNQALNDDSSFAARIAELNRNLQAAEEDLARVRAKTLVARETNLSVQKILEQRTSIKGIYGTVAELGRVQGKYSLALEVAAGPRINSIVVQNEDVAAECIRFLKQNRLGVASFLPLTKLKADFSEPGKYSKASGVHGMAIDLVSFDPRFRKVFSYVFGSTLVVDSIDVAKRIGIGEARMVSIDGDLAELSGAMHGGFRQKRQLAFQEQDSERELKEKESRVSEIEGLVESLKAQRAGNEARIASLKQKKSELEGEIIKAEKSLSLESSDLEASFKQKSEIAAMIASDDSMLASIQDSLGEKSRLIADIKTRKQKLRDQISELRNPAIVAELNAFEQKRQQLIEEILQIDNQFRHSELQISEVFGREQEKSAQILRQLDREQEQFNSEKSSLASRLEGNKKLLRDAEEKSSSFRKKYRELFEQKARMAEEMQKSEEKIIRKEEQINTTELRINNVSLKNAEMSSAIAGIRQEFEQYSDVQLLEEASDEKLKEHLYRYEKSISEMGNVNLKALEVYDDVEKQYNSLLEKKDKLVSEKSDVMNLMQEIEVRKKELFMSTFNVLNENFVRVFKDISTKGEARLVIEDESKLFESGVRIRVNLTGEKYLDIRGLSGGEKSLTALAFIFAIQEYHPASFYIFDEVDAALDKKNSEKLSQLIKRYADKAQYIVISHNDNVLTSASTLYGVSMDEHGISNVVSLKV
ncbi:chromosome segregation protein SMC [Candidatus Woesearchaeota archaeon]|nr:chromosome segregation protein SMC [Candidatus Woesearchaeota archaeon]